jgi:acetylornithine deacetylase
VADPFDLLERLVAIPSPTGREGEYAAAVAAQLRQDGYEVEAHEVAPGRPNLVARPRGGRPQVVFSTHLDVVPPHIAPRREGERLYGRGAADTKGPLVAMLEAARALAKEGVRVGFLLVVGEEVDHSGALAAARALDLGRAPIILGEPTSNRVVAAQKGLLRVRLSATGVAGHSAFPDRGVSAIHRLLDVVHAVRRGPWPRHELLGDTSINIGAIAGGVAANVFAPSAEATALLRLVEPAAAALARIEAAARKVEGVSVERISGNDPVLFEPPPGFPTCVIPFNSDASYLAPLGRVWLCGPGAIEVAHADHEHIDRADLEEGARVYARLARAALGG